MKQRSPNSHQPPAKSSTSSLVSSLLTRRNLLLLSVGSLAALSTWQWLKPSAQQKTKSPADLSGNSSIASNQQIDFLALSTTLTSRQHLHPQTSARIYIALSAQNPEFQLRAAALFQFIQLHQIKDVDIIVNTLKNNAKLAPLETVLHQIIEAWYLGVAGDGTHSKVIAYESALMFDQVRDVLGVPSYCPAPPGYWAKQPFVLKRKVG